MGHGSPSLSTSMGQRSPSLSTSMGLGFLSLSTCMGRGSPSLSTSMDGSWISILVYEHGSEISILVYDDGRESPSLSTSMENDLSCPSVFFLIEKIDPLDSIFLTRSFDPLRRSSFAQCSPKKASYQETHESQREIYRSRDDFIGI